MCKIYVDFDGVLVDTPIYIMEKIKLYGNVKETFVNIEWKELLQKCNEYSDNINFIKEKYENFEIKILTHVYSENEKEEKRKFIKEKIGNIEVLTVPYNIKKNKFVNPKENILIDDYNVNIDYWVNDGGIGMLFNNQMKLEDILREVCK